MKIKGIDVSAYVWDLKLMNQHEAIKKVIPPGEVISPKAYWSLIDVLFDEGEEGVAVALGRWAGKPTLAMRWNGSSENPIGNPQSRGLATWFILPSGAFSEAIIGVLKKNCPEKMPVVRNFLPEIGGSGAVE